MTSCELEGIEDVLIHNKILEARAEEIQQSKAKLEEETGFLKHQIRIRDKKLDTAAANVAKLEGTIVQLKKHLEEKEKALQHHKLSKNELLNKIDALTEENLRLRSDLELYRTAVGTPSPSSLLANATSGAANGNELSRTNSSLVPGTSQTLWRNGSTTSLLHAPASSANMSKKDQFAQLMEHKVLCVVLRRRLREARQRHMDIMAKGEAMAMEVEDQRSYINDLIAKNGGNGVINLKTLARRTSSGMSNDNEGGELTPEDEAQLDAYYKSTNRPRIFGSKVGHGGDFYYGPHSNFPAQTLELQTRAEEDFIESKFKQSAYGDALKNMAGEMEAIARRAKETHDKQQNALWHVFTEATRRGGSLLANPKQDYLSNLAVGLREYNMTMGNLMRIFRENAAKLMNSERNVREVLEKSIRAEIAAGKIHVGTQADIESPEMTVMTERIAYMEERQREVSAKHNKEVAALEDSRRKAEINTQFLQSKIFELHESVYEALSAVHRHRFQWVASVPNVFADIIAIANKQAAATSINDDITSSPTKRGYGHRHHAHTKNNSNKSVQFNLRIGHAIDEERSLLAKFAHYFLSSELFGTVNTASANLQKNSSGSASNPFMFTYSAVNDASVTGDVGAVNPLSSTAFSNATNAMMMAMLGGGGGTSSRASSPRGSRVTPTMRGGSDNKREEKDDGFIEFQKNAKAKSRMTGQKELAKSTFEELQKILKKEKKQEGAEETTIEAGRHSRGRSGSTTKKEGKFKPQQSNSSTPPAPLSKGSKGSFVRSNSTSFASSSLLSPATKGGNSRTSTPPPPPPPPALQSHAQHAVASRPVHAPLLNKEEENERIAQSSNQATPTNNKASEGGVAQSRRDEAGEVAGGVTRQSLSFMGRRHNIASAFSSRVASGMACQSQTRRGQQEVEYEDDGESYMYRRVTSTGDDEDVSFGGLWSERTRRRGGQHDYNDEPIEGIKRADSFLDSNSGDAASLRARVGDTSKSHTCMSDMRSNNEKRDTLGGVLTPCCLSPTVSPMSSALAPPPPPPQKAEKRGGERPATSNKQHVSGGGSFRNAVMVRHNSSSSTPASNATTPTATPRIVPSAPSSRRPSPSRTNSILTKSQHSLYHHHNHQGSTLAQLTIVTCTTEEEVEANNAGRIGGATTGRRDSTVNNVHSNANTVSLMLSPKAPAPATGRQPDLFSEENTIATTGDSIVPPAPRRRASTFTSATTTVTSSVSTFTTDTATATSKASRRDSDVVKVRHPEGSKEVKSRSTNGKNSMGKIDHDNGNDDDHNPTIFDFPLPSSSSEALVNANVERRPSVRDFVSVTGTNVRDRGCVSDGDEKENDDDIFGRMVSSVSMNPLISGEAPTTTAAKASFSSTQPALTRMLTWQKQQQENWERKRRSSDAATATTTPTIIFTTNAALSSALYNNGGNSSTTAHKKPSSKGNNSNSFLNKENGGVGGTVSMVDASRWVGGLSRSQSYTNNCGLGAANAGARTYSSSPSSNHPVAAPNASSSCATAASLLPIITNNNSQTAGKPLASRRTNPTAK